MTKEESKQWFKLNGGYVGTARGACTVESMYEAFKARLIDELRTEEWKNALIR